jgi:multisubunit Na+/H+ antiporter MnhC subunit
VTVLALLLAVAVQVYKREGTLDPDEIPAVRG